MNKLKIIPSLTLWQKSGAFGLPGECGLLPVALQRPDSRAQSGLQGSFHITIERHARMFSGKEKPPIKRAAKEFAFGRDLAWSRT